MTDLDLAAQIRSAVAPGRAFRIACGRVETAADFVLPCPARLTEALLLEALRCGAEKVEVAVPDCAPRPTAGGACPWGKAAAQIGRTLETAGVLLEALGLDPNRFQRIHVPFNGTRTSTSVRSRREDPIPRRDVLRTFALQTAGLAASTLPQPEPEKTQEELFRDRIRRHPENSKRSHLLEVLRSLAPAEPHWRIQGPPAPFAVLEVGPKCIGCNVCETLCPTGALRRSEKDGVFSLEFDAGKCTACGVCAESCFPRAIRMRREFSLERILKGETELLMNSPRRICRACGAGFLGDPADFCPMCMALSKRRETAALRWFEGGNALAG